MPRETTSPSGCVTVIQPRRGLRAIDPAALWRYRDLWWLLALRDLRVRYKQSLLGVAWAVIQPLAMVLILSLVLGQVLGLSRHVEGSYAVFVCAGMVPWMLFAATVTAASNSLVNSADMLRKVFFPRLIVPLSAAGAPLADFVIAITVLLGVMIWSGSPLSVQLLWLAPLMACVLLAALATGILLAAVTVTYRDVRLAVPFLLQLWFFATPVIYPLPVSPKWQWLMSFNPMYGPIQAFRAAVYGKAIDVPSLVISCVTAGFVLLIGLCYFARTERRFADVV